MGVLSKSISYESVILGRRDVLGGAPPEAQPETVV